MMLSPLSRIFGQAVRHAAHVKHAIWLMLMACRCYPAQLRLQMRAAVLWPCTSFLTGQADIMFVT